MHHIFDLPHEKWQDCNMDKILFATTNAHKVQQFHAMTSGLPFEFITQADLNIPDIEETGLTFVENALLKARNASKLSGLPAIADDSGLMVDALNGAPGIYSARYAGIHADYEANNQKLLNALKDVPFEKRTARLYCVLVFLKSHDDQCPIIAEGFWNVQVLCEKKVPAGFGYEPILYVPTHDCCVAEIPLDEKMKIGHRGRAFMDLLNKHQTLLSFP